MRHGALEFARDVADLPIATPVIEIGARAAEGQEDIADLRPMFPSEGYLGCDIQAGPGVDRIEDVHALTFETGSIGTVLCLETLEHVADPIRAVEEMHRVLAPGGMLAISSLMFFPIHAHPWDFWRFTPEGFAKLLEPFESSLVMAHGWSEMPEGVYGIGIKGPADDLGPHRLPRTKWLSEHWADDLPVDFGPIRLRTRDLWRYAATYTARGARSGARSAVRRVRRKLGRR